jgi:tetratricopeptide (TPR) repeat protein
MKQFATTVFFFTVFIFPVFADQANQLFEAANGAYQDKKYSEASELYEQLLAEGYRSAELEYNLGNAYFRQNDLGRAILHFERAKLLSPGDADIEHNLKIARSQVVDEFSLLPKFFLANLWGQMRMSMSATAWGIIALVIWWAGMAGLGIWLFGKSRVQKKQGFFYGITALVISLLPLALALSRANFDEDTRHAIVLAKETPVRSAPDANGNEILNIH